MRVAVAISCVAVLAAGLVAAVGTGVVPEQPGALGAALASARGGIQALWRRLPIAQSAAVTPPPAVPPVKVEVAAARRQDVPIFLDGIGTVQAYNTVNVKTQVDGAITRILFREGQDVHAGDALAVIDPRPYQAQLQQQAAARQRDQAMLQGAKLDLARYQDLVRKGFASQQQVDQQVALVGQYEGSVANDEAQMDYARTQLGYTSIAAPIDGRVGIRQVDLGNVLRAGDGVTIVTITQLRPISVVFTLSAEQVAQSALNLGTADVPVVALAADGKTELDHGTVELVDNQVDPATGTIKLKASFPNAALKLWPGNFVNGRLQVALRKAAVTVPAAAVRHGPRCDFAWVVRPDHTAASRCLTAGQTFDGHTLVERGLAPGAEVVTEGYYRLDEGSHVEIVPAAAKAE